MTPGPVRILNSINATVDRVQGTKIQSFHQVTNNPQSFACSLSYHGSSNPTGCFRKGAICDQGTRRGGLDVIFHNY